MKLNLKVTAILIALISAGTVSAKVYKPGAEQQIKTAAQLIINRSIPQHLLRLEGKYWEF
ncbi:hypothetical protein A9R01_11020 ['Osedax' symbiont bacterium Rs2_46_30_T18]|nr:hypothetical protein A9R01_11020 ['Osedax' symbiont bacterium Rs2_46_30_T18]